MNESEIKNIETSLGVFLPESYRSFLKVERVTDNIDDTTVLADAAIIIESTQEYRNGYFSLKPWPNDLVYVGNEADACPYAIDCTTGKFIRTNNGNLVEKPLAVYESFEVFREQRERKASEERETEASDDLPPEIRRRNLIFFSISYYKPLAFGLIGFFVVLPMFGLMITHLFKWIFK
jgi:hypothetical protein